MPSLATNATSVTMTLKLSRPELVHTSLQGTEDSTIQAEGTSAAVHRTQRDRPTGDVWWGLLALR